MPYAQELLRLHPGMIGQQKICFLKIDFNVCFRVNESDNPEEAKKNFIARQALGRLGTAEEIAALVTYLASNEVILLFRVFCFIFILIFHILVCLHNWDSPCDRWGMEHLDWKIIPHSSEICFIASIKQMNSFVSMSSIKLFWIQSRNYHTKALI